MKPNPAIVVAKQASALDGFHYLVTDLDGAVLGEIRWPMYAQASNARLKIHADDVAAGSVQLRCGDDNYLICFEYLRRGWQNDTRYTLQRDGQVLASASLIFKEGVRGRGVMSLELPIAATFVRHRAWFRKCFSLVGANGQTQLGRFEEPSLISFSREVRAELPEMTLPQQCFCLFLVLHLIQNQA
jgi:hypothetical protein